MLKSMSFTQFDEWAAYYEDEPWGFHADNWRMGVIAATVANGSGRFNQHVSPDDFYPRKPKVQSVQDQLKIWQSIAKKP